MLAIKLSNYQPNQIEFLHDTKTTEKLITNKLKWNRRATQGCASLFHMSRDGNVEIKKNYKRHFRFMCLYMIVHFVCLVVPGVVPGCTRKNFCGKMSNVLYAIEGNCSDWRLEGHRAMIFRIYGCKNQQTTFFFNSWESWKINKNWRDCSLLGGRDNVSNRKIS